MLEVIEAARKVTGQPLPYRKEPRRAGDAITLVADARKAKAVLGWTAVQSDIEAILKSQWDWRQRSKNPFKA